MIEVIEDMPEGTFGWKASGKLAREDYAVVVPTLRGAIDRGEKVRMLYQLGPDFHGVEPNAYWEDIKQDVSLGLGHWRSWERTALVTDESWVRHFLGAAGWLVAGELKLFAVAELPAAKQWLAR